MNRRRNPLPRIQPITPATWGGVKPRGGTPLYAVPPFTWPATAGIPPTPLRLNSAIPNSAIRNPPVPSVTWHPSPVTPASPVNDWRARLRARVAAIEKTVPADIGSQL